MQTRDWVRCLITVFSELCMFMAISRASTVPADNKADLSVTENFGSSKSAHESVKSRKRTSTASYLRVGSDEVSTVLPRHGDIGAHHGKDYRWHQVALDIWQGIIPEAWDDNVHIKNDADGPRAAATIHNQTDVQSNPKNLYRRFDGICVAAKVCAARTLWSTILHICPCLGPFLNAVSNHGPEIWNFVNHPVVVALTIGSGTAAVSGYVSAQTSAHIKATECSNTRDDAELIERVINELHSGQPERAITASIKVGDVVADITMEAIPNGQEADTKCAPPSRHLIEASTTVQLPFISGSLPKRIESSNTALATIDPQPTQATVGASYVERIKLNSYGYISHSVFFTSFVQILAALLYMATRGNIDERGVAISLGLLRLEIAPLHIAFRIHVIANIILILERLLRQIPGILTGIIWVHEGPVAVDLSIKQDQSRKLKIT